MRLVIDTQFFSSAVQMVGRLFVMCTMASGGATGALMGIAALALATLIAFALSALARTVSAFTLSALALASSAFAFASAVASVLAVVCFCSLSSFSSISRNCFFSNAISAALSAVSA